MVQLDQYQQDYIKRDWVSAVRDLVLDEEYGEITGHERRSMRSKTGRFLNKFWQDTQEFAQLVLRVRQLQAEQLLKQDPEYWADLNQPERYIQFAQYGGTECRLLYRAYFMIKGYRSFQGWDLGYDGPAVKWYAEMFKQAMKEQSVA